MSEQFTTAITTITCPYLDKHLRQTAAGGGLRSESEKLNC
jgi:hypothetical protein